ncbi:MAG: hypothetical protein VX335_04120 [Pseudomonadota bacterium]|nr:hypothetical protein [Pseudomonadota bacterium]
MTDPIKPIELIIDEVRVAETAFKPSFDIEDNETTQLTLKVNQSSPIDQQVIYLAQMIVSHNPFKLKNCDSGLITDIILNTYNNRFNDGEITKIISSDSINYSTTIFGFYTEQDRDSWENEYLNTENIRENFDLGTIGKSYLANGGCYKGLLKHMWANDNVEGNITTDDKAATVNTNIENPLNSNIQDDNVKEEEETGSKEENKTVSPDVETNIEKPLNLDTQNDDTDEEDEDNFAYAWALLGAAIVAFLVFNNWAQISTTAINIAAWVQTIAWPTTTAFLATPLGLGIGITAGVCLLAGIITLIAIQKPTTPDTGSSAIALGPQNEAPLDSSGLQSNSPKEAKIGDNSDGLESLVSDKNLDNEEKKSI